MLFFIVTDVCLSKKRQRYARRRMEVAGTGFAPVATQEPAVSSVTLFLLWSRRRKKEIQALRDTLCDITLILSDVS